MAQCPPPQEQTHLASSNKGEDAYWDKAGNLRWFCLGWLVLPGGRPLLFLAGGGAGATGWGWGWGSGSGSISTAGSSSSSLSSRSGSAFSSQEIKAQVVGQAELWKRQRTNFLKTLLYISFTKVLGWALVAHTFKPRTQEADKSL